MLALPLAVLAACSSGGGGNNGGNSPPPPPPPPPQDSVQVSGTVSYEFVPANANCAGLNFSETQTRPIRGATVRLLDATSGAELGTMASGPTGAYSFIGIDADTLVRLQVRAELKRTGVPAWDVEVRDNVDTSPSPPPLATRPLYVLDGTQFNTGTADIVRNLAAQTGWGGSSYTGARAAAPFAILDAISEAGDPERLLEGLGARTRRGQGQRGSNAGGLVTTGRPGDDGDRRAADGAVAGHA